jgi:fermentation-respiration switch protein FrsA (DUF1100 family)
VIVTVLAAAFACPLTLPGDAAAAEAGFRALTTTDAPRATRIGRSAGRRWRSVQFSDGAPEEQAWLAPDRDGRTLQRWSFAPTGGRAIHVSCGYGPGAPVLTRTLRSASCTVTVGARGTPVAMRCR